MGYFGLTEWEFKHTTPKAFYYKLKGFEKLREHQFKTSWEQTRFISLQIINTAGKSVKKELKPKDLILFDWERKKSLPKKEIENNRERFEYLKKRWHNQG